MTRPLAEYIISQVLAMMDFLRPHIAESHLEDWDDARQYVEAISLKQLPEDEQFG